MFLILLCIFLINYRHVYVNGSRCPVAVLMKRGFHNEILSCMSGLINEFRIAAMAHVQFFSGNFWITAYCLWQRNIDVAVKFFRNIVQAIKETNFDPKEIAHLKPVQRFVRISHNSIVIFVHIGQNWWKRKKDLFKILNKFWMIFVILYWFLNLKKKQTKM